ncbi:DNA repair protein RadA [Mycobacteroides immunogenum]|uniref:DNA repair protein RadA n=1 Tax=Mycobacteroides immunogenum TaxID=83262 RepID=UPI0025B78C74|nr:DNA repair protein RadA [Mycobacteroides immunogenum]WJR34430.1 DNA repair protein RadA [Mycobacteroides immunogenum]
MAKPRAQYRCSECQHTTAKWVGRCPDCGTWGSVSETAVLSSIGGLGAVRAVAPASAAVPITSIATDTTRHQPTGVSELDRVLGGGVIRGSVNLLAGEPGVGKSTLLLKVVHQWALSGGRALYISGEESAAQVRLRAERTGCVHDEVYLASESDLHSVLGHIEAVKPTLTIIDSVQTMSTTDADGVTGGVTQVRAVTTALTMAAKSSGVAMVLVGHVTKDGAIAGPRSLEHLVDVVLHFEGDKHSALRMVRGIKNRFGAADEVGCFQLRDKGIDCVSDPSGLFLEHREKAAAGTAVTVTLDGKRPLLGEVQSLVTTSTNPSPRRAVSGLDHARSAMVTAVLERHGRLPLGNNDIYMATVGGMRMTDPSADLAILMAVASAYTDIALPANMVFIGEVGLAGDIRRTAAVGKRIAEAARLGYTHAVIPPEGDDLHPAGMHLLRCPTVGRALEVLAEARKIEPEKRPNLRLAQKFTD